MTITRFTLTFLFLINFKNLKAQNTLNPDSLKFSILTYPELQNQYFDIQSDTTLVVNFWASWCKPCKAEMPYFEQLREEFANKKVKILLVTIDVAEQIESRVKPYLLLNHIENEVVSVQDKVSPLKWIPLICPEWGGSIPITVVMNKTDGTYFETCFVSYEKLKEAVLPFVK